MDDRSKQRLDALRDESGAYLGKLFATTSFGNWPNGQFAPIRQPVTLDGVLYNLRLFRDLTGHPIKGTELPLKYTFCLAIPPDGIKERFLAERKKMADGNPYDKNVVGEYYRPFVPFRPEMQELMTDLATLLERSAFVGKPYRFTCYQVCVTADSDFALILGEVGSMMQIIEATK